MLWLGKKLIEGLIIDMLKKKGVGLGVVSVGTWNKRCLVVIFGVEKETEEETKTTHTNQVL